MVVERLSSIAAQAVPGQVPLTPVVGGALLALLITVVLWPVAGYLITATHEGGHALFGSAAGGAVASVRVNPSQTGETTGIFPVVRAGRDLFRFGGYITPSLFGVVGAILLDDGQVRPLLWLGLFFLFLLMLQVNDLFSLLVILLYGGLVVLVLARRLRRFAADVRLHVDLVPPVRRGSAHPRPAERQHRQEQVEAVGRVKPSRAGTAGSG